MFHKEALLVAKAARYNRRSSTTVTLQACYTCTTAAWIISAARCQTKLPVLEAASTRLPKSTTVRFSCKTRAIRIQTFRKCIRLNKQWPRIWSTRYMILNSLANSTRAQQVLHILFRSSNSPDLCLRLRKESQARVSSYQSTSWRRFLKEA